MSGNEERKRTGVLVRIGSQNYGHERLEFYRCRDCGILYPLIGGEIRCNGEAITRCLCAEPEYRPGWERQQIEKINAWIEEERMRAYGKQEPKLDKTVAERYHRRWGVYEEIAGEYARTLREWNSTYGNDDGHAEWWRREMDKVRDSLGVTR